MDTKNSIIYNEGIKAKIVLLIDENGVKVGETPFIDALQYAYDKNLDLVQMNQGKVPVCKALDKNKYLYEQKQRAKQNKKNNTAKELKEITFSPNIAQHDLNIKISQISKFLKNGNETKVTLRCKGRECALIKEYANDLLYAVSTQLSDIAVIKKDITISQKTAFIILTPSK